MDTEWKNMVEGRYYDPLAPGLVEARLAAREWMAEYNSSDPRDPERRTALLRGMLGSCGERVCIEPRLIVDYGCNIHLGEDFYANFECLFLDSAPIVIGARAMLGPGVHVYTARHPLQAVVRSGGRELASPVTIGDDVWIGGHATICPGVRIGDGVVIAAGSVVVKDAPDNVVIGGNPARVIRAIDQSLRPEGFPWSRG